VPVALQISSNPTGDLSLPVSIRNVDFAEFTVSAYLTEPTLDLEVITSVEITEVIPDSNVVITNGVTSSTVSGKNTNQFLDQFTFVEKGSSDLLETPTTVDSVDDLPPEKDFFSLNQDSRLSVMKEYTVTVTYETFGMPDTLSQTLTQEVMNDYEAVRSFVQNYYT